jgi:hypothetical protein
MGEMLVSVLSLMAALAPPVQADAAKNLVVGLAGALRGCEEWVLNPASWANGTEPFLKTVNLGATIAPVAQIEDVQQPPEDMRVANHYWRINSTPSAGYTLVVSDRLPMCHITGGGEADLQPVVEAVLDSRDFERNWKAVGGGIQGEMRTTSFESRTAAGLVIHISRATSAGGRRDRVQMLATATYNPD